MWLGTFYEVTVNACVTTGNISGICCDLDGFCLQFVRLWAWRLRCGYEHARKGWHEELVSFLLEKLFAGGFQITSLCGWNDVISKKQLKSILGAASNESNSSSIPQENPRALWNPKAHYGIRKNPSVVLIKNQLNPDHELTFDLPKNHFNIIFQSMPKPPTWSLPDLFIQVWLRLMSLGQIILRCRLNFACYSHSSYSC